MQKQLETRLMAKFPEIERVFARTGTAEIAADPMPPSISDGYIMLEPETQWPEPRRSGAELLAAIQHEVANFRGTTTSFRSPSSCASTNSSPACAPTSPSRFSATTTTWLNYTANRMAKVLQDVDGATAVKVEQTTGLPMLTVTTSTGRRQTGMG